MNSKTISKNTQITQENPGGGGNLTNCDISQITSTSIDFFNYAKEVYSYLEDDVSKGIFEQVIIKNISFTNFEVLHPYVNDFLKSFINKFNNKIQSISSEEFVVIYGCSIQGQALYKSLNRQNNIVFCDRNYETINHIFNIPVISPNELTEKYYNSTVLLCVGEASSFVFKFLLENGIAKQNIIEVGVVDVESQYFDELVKFSEKEIFVDAGCYDGETSCRFAKNTNFTYDKIFAFEPDKKNQISVDKNEDFNKLKNVKMYPIGLWDTKETLYFNSLAGASSITSTGDIEIKCDSLDNVLGDEPVTFIKMDIEGAELNALKGARNIITKYKPKLAISIYHKPEDIIDIPMYIKSLVPEYKLYIRHYSTSLTETVLYAVID